MIKRLTLLLFTVFFAINVLAAPVEPARNKDGSIVTGVLTADFNPSGGILRLPSNQFFLGTTDLTLNPPVADPNNFGDPLVALSAIDGFSTTERWVTTFSSLPNTLDPASVIPGQSVRMFEVSTIFGTIVAVSGIVRELTPGVEYVTAVVSGSVLAIIPLVPLAEMTTYMAVLTNDIKDTAGNDATPDTTYFLSQRQTPWVDENGKSTYSLVPDGDAQALEGLRQITLGQEAAAASVGIPKEDIILSWTAQTQAITPVLIARAGHPTHGDVVATGRKVFQQRGPGRFDENRLHTECCGQFPRQIDVDPQVRTSVSGPD